MIVVNTVLYCRFTLCTAWTSAYHSGVKCRVNYVIKDWCFVKRFVCFEADKDWYVGSFGVFIYTYTEFCSFVLLQLLVLWLWQDIYIHHIGCMVLPCVSNQLCSADAVEVQEVMLCVLEGMQGS